MMTNWWEGSKTSPRRRRASKRRKVLSGPNSITFSSVCCHQTNILWRHNKEIDREERNMSNKQFTIPSMEQRKSQINLLNGMEQDRRSSLEFIFPDGNLLHKRRQSADYNSATQSEDDESVPFEVSLGLSGKNSISFCCWRGFFQINCLFNFVLSTPVLCYPSPLHFTSQAYMVIEFEKNTNREALHWIIDRIRMKKSDGGAQLLIRKEPCLRWGARWIRG